MKGMLKNIRRRFSSNAKEDKKDSPKASGKGEGSPSIDKDEKKKAEGVIGSPAPPAKKEAAPPQYSGGTPLPDDYLTPLPSFKDCPAADRQNLLMKKLRLCCVIFNFQHDDPKDNRGKEVKRQVLLELVDHISSSKNSFTEAVLGEVINMVSGNLFRALPPSSAKSADPEEDEPVLNASWPHLQIVYEFLLRFVVSTDTDTKILKKYINGPFLIRLLDLFDSEDPRERDYLKTILHRIYGKFMSLRSFIRSAINNVFFTFVYETERHNGIGELLEILGSIINGFALPLKEEHKLFLKNVLTPLHKAKTLSQYHQQLAYCVSQFVEKDPTLAPMVINGLVKFWPLVNSAKEVLFLNELEELLELTPPEHFQTFMAPLFKQVSRSLCSPHFQVAERALFLWNNEYIATLVSDFREVLLPLLFPALHANSSHHWNPTVNSLTFNVLKLFKDMDNDLYDRCFKTYQDSESKKASTTLMEKYTNSKWDFLDATFGAPGTPQAAAAAAAAAVAAGVAPPGSSSPLLGPGQPNAADAKTN